MSKRSLSTAINRRKYIIPAGISVSDIMAALLHEFNCIVAPVRSLKRIYMDSFDWRMYRAGAVMEVESGANYSALSWRDFLSDTVISKVLIKQTPHFSWKLPPGDLRKRMEPVLEMRTLLPLVKTHNKVHGMNVVNKDEKIVVRLLIEETQLSAMYKSRHNKFPVMLYVEPVKGYSKHFQQVLCFIEQQFSIRPDKQGMARRVYEAAGLQPGDHSAKLNFQLTPDMRSDATARKILLQLFETMQSNEAGMKADLDSEFLHDYRVAVRRTRALLGQIKGVIPQPKLARFVREFSWLGEFTGPTRDMDVFILEFDAFKNGLPIPLREDINPFLDYLEKRQKNEHERLVNHLASSRYRKLISDWQVFLRSPLPKHSSLPYALRPVIGVASERIWHRVRRVFSEGEAIQADSPPEDLHELRKTCKKLRYLMEFFFSLYPQKQIGGLIKSLKLLQNQLGEYQDLHTQLASLESIRAQMIAEGMANDRMLVAFDLILQTIDQRQEQVRQMFSMCFTSFADKQNRENFAKLFNTGNHVLVKKKHQKEQTST